MTAAEIITCSLATITMVVSILAVVFMTRKQRNEVSFSFEPASKKEFETHLERNRVEHEIIAGKINQAQKEIDAHLTSRAKNIYDKLDESARLLRLEMQHQTDRRDETIDNLRTDLQNKMDANRKELSERMDDVPAQVVTILKNTGAI